MSDVLSQVRQAVRAHQMLAAGEAAVVAVSGGCDSMVCLDVLRRLARRAGWRLVVAHFNHQLRGRASDGDERLVRRIALGHGFPSLVGRADVRAHARQQGVSIEMAARELRHAFLARAAREAGATRVVLAHHADDQVETFLLRLTRGTGAGALAGMNWVGPSPADRGVVLLRPLLGVTRGELHDYARHHHVAFRHDTSNASLDTPRNFIRQRLLPMLARHLQPAIVETIRRVMTVVGDEAEVVDELARRWLDDRRRRPFERAPVAVQRRILAHALRGLGLEPAFDWIEWLRLRPGKPVTIARNLRVWRDEDGRLRTSAPHEPGGRVPPRGVTSDGPYGADHRPTKRTAPMPLGASTGATCVLDAPGGQGALGELRFRWRIRPGSLPRRAVPDSTPGVERFDADGVGRRITLRYWAPGDRFQPIGLGRPAKLQDLFTNAKVPRTERHRRLIGVTDGGEIFWVEGLRIGERFKLTETTRRVLEWRWDRSTVRAVTV